MEYNVYYHSFNGDEIKTFNVLREDRYVMNCIRGYKKNMSRDEFDERLDKDCMSMYWSRCEYEVIVSAWVGGKAKEKIDIYQQLKINWSVFSEICWKIYMGEIVNGNN